MVMKIDARTSRKYKMVQEHLREVGKFNPELRNKKSAKRIRKDAKLSNRDRRATT